MQDENRAIAQKTIKGLLNLRQSLRSIASKATGVRSAKYGEQRPVSFTTLSKIMGSRPWQVSRQMVDVLREVLSKVQADFCQEIFAKYPIVVFDYCPIKPSTVLDEKVNKEAASAILAALATGLDATLTIQLPDCLLGAVAWLGAEDSGVLIAVANSALSSEDRCCVLAHELEDARQRLLRKVRDIRSKKANNGGDNVQAAWG
jgi:hypothetical protein